MTSDLRFRRTDRVRLPKQYQVCFAQGSRVSGRFFRLHVLAGECARLGLAVSRKVDTKAVVRNRIKRTARESFRVSRATLPKADCVLVAKREAAAASNAELRADLASLWRRAAALKPTPAAGTMRDAVDPPASRDDA
jgi:ribonuclease P protein component